MNYQPRGGRTKGQHAAPAAAASAPSGGKTRRKHAPLAGDDGGEDEGDGESEPKGRPRKRPPDGVVPPTHSEDEAAIRAGCGRSTIRRAIDAGELVARKLYGRTLILEEDLNVWVRSLPIREPGRKAA